MGLYLNPDNQYFNEISKSGEYVDKSGLITYLNSRIGKPRPYIASSRPRRFGKSLAVKMIAAYYSKGCDSKALFENLEISKDASFQKHLNQYDVINLDIQYMRSVYLQINNKNKKTPLDYIQAEVLKELKEEYPDHVDAGCDAISQALSDINYATGNQFIILVDEWDCFFREEKDNNKIIDDYIIFLRSLFKGDAPDRFVKLAYITGILPIKKYGTQSALNNFRELTMTAPDGIAKYIGFTEDEVKVLCEQNRASFAKMQKWYDGYIFDQSDDFSLDEDDFEGLDEDCDDSKRFMHVYCPNSVMEAITNREFHSYWSKTETYESLKSYIEMNFDGLKDKVLQMMAGERCPIKVNTFQNDMTSMNSSDDVLTLLVHLGYLAYDSKKKEAFIPNFEVRESFESAIQTGKFADTARAIDESAQLIEDTISMNAEAVAEQIEKVHDENISAIAYNNELSLATVILLAYYKARDEYNIVRELPTGKGFADIVFVPKRNSDKPALIVELKWDKSTDGAIKQIKEKHYASALKEYTGDMLLVGINYDKKNKKHQCEIEIRSRAATLCAR